MRCQMYTFLKTAQRKAEEWADTPPVANTYKIRVQQLQSEIENLACTCPDDALLESEEVE